jgi:hypothetical protein
MNNNFFVSKGILNLKYRLYKFCDFSNKDLGHTTFIVKNDNWRRIWTEILGHLNFLSMKLNVKYEMVTRLPRVFPLEI